MSVILCITEHTEWKQEFDVYWRIMKGTANIIKYFCPCLFLSVLFIYVLLIFWGGFLFSILVEIDNIFVE